MNTLSSIALSGMNAAQTALQAGAHNVANLGTPGFRRQTVVQTANEAGGTRTALARAPSPGDAPEADLVGLLQSRHAFLANLAVFRTGDRMAGSLLDVLG